MDKSTIASVITGLVVLFGGHGCRWGCSLGADSEGGSIVVSAMRLAGHIGQA